MELVTDRTESDALLGNEKGVYGYMDLNRVEQAVAKIVAVLPGLGISLPLKVKIDWVLPEDFTAATFPTASQMERYLRNVAAIRDAFSVSADLPESMDKLNWQGANDIEKVLQVAVARIDGIVRSYRYSGEIFAGEEF